MNEMFLLSLLTELNRAGGKAYLVGGAVRDKILERTPKDYDVEVYNLTSDQVKKVMGRFGPVTEQGGFGVYSVYSAQYKYAIEVSLPRTDNKRGTGHQGFNIQHDPKMRIYDAASRRDFTMNALMLDVQDGEVIDLFNGVAHLKAGKLVPINDRFMDDPIRLLRAAVYISELGLVPDEVLYEYGQKMVGEMGTIPAEGLMKNLVRILEGPHPDWAFNFLRMAGWLPVFPEINDLVGVDQDALWHPEGDAFTHTMMALAFAAQQNYPLHVRLAVLLHDIGKASTTTTNDKGRVIAPGHEDVGADMARAFLTRLRFDNETIQVVPVLVAEHMITRNRNAAASERVVQRLISRLGKATIEQLIQVMMSDKNGRAGYTGIIFPLELEELEETARKVNALKGKPEPLLMGRDLLTLGFKPGPEMGNILKAVYDLQLSGEITSREAAISYVMGLYS